MIRDAIEAIRVLAGDALIAAGELIHGGSDHVDVWPDDFGAGAMECDGPDSTKPIPFDEVRAALGDLPDSVLIRSAAVLVQQTVLYTPNPFVDALRDRAEQFEAAELAALRSDVAAAKGVPVSALTGSTKDELEKAADDLIAWRGDKPKPKPDVKTLKSGATDDSPKPNGKAGAAAALRNLRAGG